MSPAPSPPSRQATDAETRTPVASRHGIDTKTNVAAAAAAAGLELSGLAAAAAAAAEESENDTVVDLRPTVGSGGRDKRSSVPTTSSLDNRRHR